MFVGVNPVINDTKVEEKDFLSSMKSFAKTGSFSKLGIAVSDKNIDVERLNYDINEAIKVLNDDGYSVVSVTPITSGEYKYGCNPGWGYGFSYTDAVIILAKRIDV